MKKAPLILAVLVLLLSNASAQKNKALPHQAYSTMVTATTSADIVLLLGNGGSLAIDKDNIGILKDFINNTSCSKINAPQAAVLSCQLDGREYLSANIYLGDNDGVVVFNMGGKEYVNQLNPKGAQFFRSLMLRQ